MNILKTTFAAVLIMSATNIAVAAESVQNNQSRDKIGVVSANGELTLDSLEKVLARKASQAGASGYRITSVGGNNYLHGTAEIYR